MIISILQLKIKGCILEACQSIIMDVMPMSLAVVVSSKVVSSNIISI